MTKSKSPKSPPPVQSQNQKSFLQKRVWNSEEDTKLHQLVKEHGPTRWSFIASQMGDRIGKQCRERWHNHLNPKIKKENWSENEEWLLFLSHQLLGNKWAEISKYLFGRTDNCIKNHWNSTMRKKLDKYRLKLIPAVNLFKSAPAKFSKKFSGLEKSLIKDIIKENCLEVRFSGRKSDRQICEEAQVSNVQEGVLGDLSKLSVQNFNEENFIDDLIKLAHENELTFSEMTGLLGFIQQNQEEIVGEISEKEDFNKNQEIQNLETKKEGNFASGHSSSLKPKNNIDNSLNQKLPEKLPSSLLIPNFFINFLNLGIARSWNDNKSKSPIKVGVALPLNINANDVCLRTSLKIEKRGVENVEEVFW